MSNVNQVNHSQKSVHIAFWKFVRPKFKESGYINRQLQVTSYFRNTLEFTRTVWVQTRVVFPHVQSFPAYQRHKLLS